MAKEKSGKKKKTPFLSLLSNDFSFLVAFLRARRTNDLIDPRVIYVLIYVFLSRAAALTDLKLPPRSCDARYISSSLYLPVTICLVYFISLYPSVLFSLVVILAVILRLPTRVSRGTFSSACAKRNGGPPSHYQNSNVLLFSILQIESKYKIASSSINNLYRKNTKG